MAKSTIPQRTDAQQLGDLLDSTEIARLVAELEATRWTGRPGYPIRAMVGMALVKSLYAIPTWARTSALVAEHAAPRAALVALPPSTPATASRPSATARSSPAGTILLKVSSDRTSVPCDQHV